jgi:hypothetical protein
MSGPWHPSGRGRVSARKPQALATCDRCGLTYNHKDLVWQWDWRGTNLQNLKILVCKRTCLDKPQIQLRAIVIPPDPLPVINARPEMYSVEVPSYMATLANQRFVTTSGMHLTMMIRVTPTQFPPGFLPPNA